MSQTRIQITKITCQVSGGSASPSEVLQCKGFVADLDSLLVIKDNDLIEFRTGKAGMLAIGSVRSSDKTFKEQGFLRTSRLKP